MSTIHSSSDNTGNPWIGLDSYHEGQALYGRGREVQDLAMAVFYHRHTVVYGRSGIGKSSLLHAGIFPEARRRGCLPVSVRLDHFSSVSYREQLIRVITDAVLAAGGTMNDSAPDQPAPQSLWEFFHRYQPMRDGQQVTPLIVIDQFEEIFTLSRNRQQVKAFFDELADLFNDVMPDYLHAETVQTDAKTDSVFAGFSLSLADERFAREMPCHLVFVLREDYLSYLERYSQSIPDLKQNRYGVMPITYSQAMEIIVKPREGLVSTEVADAIIRHIVTEDEVNSDTPVDAAILSLFLSRLYEKKGDATAISLQLVDEQGDALLEDFYEEIVAPLDIKTVHFLEDTLINADGHRENVTVESLYKIPWLKRDAVAALERSHLLRVFSYGDVQRVEFAHDVLCPIIVRRRDKRVADTTYRRSQRRAIFAYISVIVLVILGIYAYVQIKDWRADLQKRQDRLADFEATMLESSIWKMLDEHDTFGAIRVLVNCMPWDLSNPSSATAKKESLLRWAVDSLYCSQESCVARVNYRGILRGRGVSMVVSPSQKLSGLNDYRNSKPVVIDNLTGSRLIRFERDKPTSSARRLVTFFRSDGTHSAADIGKVGLILTDISIDDQRCLIIADDTTLLECFIRLWPKDGWCEGDGKTWLCLHDFHRKVLNAAYDSTSTRIAVLLEDSTYQLYDEKTGKRIESDDAEQTVQAAFASVTPRQKNIRRLIYDEYESINIFDSVEIRSKNYSATIHRLKEIKENPVPEDLVIHQTSPDREACFRKRVDSVLSNVRYLRYFKEAYEYDENVMGLVRRAMSGDNVGDMDTILTRHLWPMAINAKEDRLVFWHGGKYIASQIIGVYPHNGAVFYEKILPQDLAVHTLHFTEDDQYIVINAGEDTQTVLPLKPLPEFMEQCRNMFFMDWMTEEEKYDVISRYNGKVDY